MATQQPYNAAVDFVDRNVEEGRGDKVAVCDPQRALTYSQLLDAAARVGPALARFGVEAENRVALVVFDTVDFPILFWGAIRSGSYPYSSIHASRWINTDSCSRIQGSRWCSSPPRCCR